MTAHAGATSAGDSLSSSGSDIRGVSVGQLISEVSSDFSTLMRQEVALAKAEIKEEATKAAKGAGMFGGAGYAAHLTVLFLSVAAWWGLAAALDHIGLAALIVAVIWGVIAGVLFLSGRSAFKKVNPKPERTVNTVSEIPPALKPNS